MQLEIERLLVSRQLSCLKDLIFFFYGCLLLVATKMRVAYILTTIARQDSTITIVVVASNLVSNHKMNTEF